MRMLAKLAARFTTDGRGREYRAIVHPYQEGAILSKDAALVKPWKLYNTILGQIRH
jgi:hypothetical protein